MIDWNGNGRLDPVDVGISLSSVSHTENTSTDLCGYPFEFIQELAPERNAFGKIRLFDPKTSYLKSKTTPLNKYGEGPFCKFSLHSGEFGGVAGVYAIFDDEGLLYIGLTQNLAQRFNQGYGSIAPKNCYEGGQSTNCKINAMVLSKYLSGQHVYLFFCKTQKYKSIEAELIAYYSPPYNTAKPEKGNGIFTSTVRNTYEERKDTQTSRRTEENPTSNDFELIWHAILAHAGETFYTATGKPFTYTKHDSYVVPSNAKTAKLYRGNFENAYRTMNVYSPAEFNKKIVGPSYVKAILKDARICS